MRKKKIQTSESEFVTEGKTNQKSTVGPKKYLSTKFQPMTSAAGPVRRPKSPILMVPSWAM